MFSINLSSQTDSSDRSPVIAIGGFANNFGKFSETTHSLIALRDRVVSDLVRNYDCTVLSRSNGYDMAVEKYINDISGINKDAASAINAIPAADYAITGYCDWGKWRKKRDVNVDFVIVETNLNQGNKANFRTSRITEYDVMPPDKFSGVISERIAKDLNLRKKTSCDVYEGKIEETWAVMPFSRLEDKNKLKMPPDRELSIKVELALQEAGRLRAIVDHTEMDKKLSEMKISSLSGATEGFAGALAKIVGSDKIIMGTVSKSYEKTNTLRVDLLLVDGRTSVVLDSRSLICDSQTIDKKVSEEVLEFLKYKYEAPILKDSTKEGRQKEARLYLGVDNAIREQLLYRGYSDLVEPLICRLNFLDSASYFANDDQELIFMIASRMCNVVDSEQLRKEFPDVFSRFVEKTETMLLKVNPTPIEIGKFDDFYGFLAKAKRLNGKYDEAMKVADSLLEKYPQIRDIDLTHSRKNLNALDPNEKLAYSYHIIRACVYVDLKEYDKALECFDKLYWYEPGINTRQIETCRMSGDEKREIEYLKRRLRDSVDMYGRLLYLMEKLEGLENTIKYFEANVSFSKRRDERFYVKVAKACIKKGDKQRAAVIINALIKESRGKTSDWIEDNWKAECLELKKQIGDIDEDKAEWKTAAQVREFPEEYKIYIQPIGDPQIKNIQEAATNIAAYFGAKVEILPGIPMPDDPVSFNKEKGKYNARPLSRMLALSNEIPPDAIILEYISKDNIIWPNGNFHTFYHLYGRNIFT
ncbi:MAG TPA: hypothetical protein PK821_03745, partial [Victivallales bacterium]|nr:hypothetical protein [Victivallales bacterium]